MRVAIIGSRNLVIDDLAKYIPPDTTEIIDLSTNLIKSQ